MDIKEITLDESNSLTQALEMLDKSGMGLLFVTNSDNQLTGILTDGDVRRALLKKETLESTVDKAMNRNFVSLSANTESSVILSQINKKVKIIPLVDENNKLVDYASLNKIRTIPIAAPSLNGNELAYVTECIKTNWISSQGKYVRKFEELFTDYHSGRKALAVSNGTVALHLALEAFGIGDGDEVIVPDLTFAASINSILYTGATPVLAEVDANTWNIDVKKAEQLITKRTKAIMPVHLYGNPCNMDDVMELSSKHNLKVIEDCAEALGSYYHRRPVGVFGDAATFSFYGNKIITTGEGGMVLFKNDEVAERAALLRDHGMQKSKKYWHLEVGYNYRLTNIQAAIGVAQFERLEEFVAAKRKVARSYNEVLSNNPYFQTPVELDGMINTYWLYTFMVRPTAPFNRDDMMSYLNQQGVETRPVFYPLHAMPPYHSFGKPEELVISQQLSSSGISLPSSVNLTEIQLAHISESIKKFIQKF